MYQIDRELRNEYGQFIGWSIELYGEPLLQMCASHHGTWLKVFAFLSVVNGFLVASAWAPRKAHAKDMACHQWLVANGFHMVASY